MKDQDYFERLEEHKCGYAPGQKEYVAALGKFTSQWSWQMYGTFVFERERTYASAVTVWKDFVNRLERETRGRLAWIRGDEGRWSGCGGPSIPLHFHSLMLFANPPTIGRVSDLWSFLAGRSHIVPYNLGKGVPWYVVKLACYPPYSYDLDNLQYFDPLRSTDLSGPRLPPAERQK